MAPRVILPILGLAALGGCAALGEPVRDADGCIPAVTVYQPGVGPGGMGQVMTIPRSCPSAVGLTPEMMSTLAAMAAADRAAREEAAGGPPAERTPPPPPVSAEAAIRNGIEDFCGWYFSDQPYSLEGLRQTAFEAGYGRGAGAQFFPLPEMLRDMSFSAMGFTAVIDNRPSDGHGVAAFVSFHHPTCQIQVFGYGQEAETVLADLQSSGWRTVGIPVRGEDWIAERYYGEESGRPLTMVVTRVIRESEQEDGRAWLDMVINVVPGEDRDRGLLFDPPA